MTDDKIHDLAEQYIESSGNSVQQEISELKEEIENLKEEKQEYPGLAEDDPLIQELNEEIQDKKSKLEGLEEEIQNSESLEEEFLDMTWARLSISNMDETVCRALNLALLGMEDNQIRAKGHLLPEDSGELSGKEARKCIYQIKMLAKDKVEGAEVVQNMWDSFGSSVKYEPFKLIAASEGGMTPEQVADKLEEETKTINNRMYNPRHQQPLDPYHKEDGKYKLSIVGEYLWKAYSTDESDISEETGGTEEDDKNSNEENKSGEDFWDEFSSQ